MLKVMAIGRMVKDIEIRMTTTGKSVGSFTLAVNRKFKQEGQPDADFINCVAWGQVADLINKYVHKGNQVGIEGRLQTRSYEHEGIKRHISEVIVEGVTLLGSKQNNQDSDLQADNTQELVNDLNEDLPF